MKSILNSFFSVLEFNLFKFRIHWIKTLYFNFRSLPIKQAIKLPVFIYSHTQFASLSGNVEIIGEIKFGMIHIGRRTDRGQGFTIIRNMGTLVIGDGVMIFQGCDFLINRNAKLVIEAKVRIRENTLVYVSELVKIGEQTGIAFQTTISEDDYHYIVDGETGVIKNSQSNIIIGKNNWIGSRTVIKKGTITPDNIIVASSYAVLNKDYRKTIPEFSIIGGVPAKLIKTNQRRVFNKKSQIELNDYFKVNNKPYVLDVENVDLDKFCL